MRVRRDPVAMGHPARMEPGPRSSTFQDMDMTVHDTGIGDTPIVASISHDQHRIEITTVDLGGVRRLGAFSSAAEAWSALDTLDCPAG